MFQDWVDRCQLMDIPLSGRKFTWGNTLCRSRLDRVLVQEQWWHSVDQMSLVGLDRHGSDHTPLILKFECLDWGPKPFRVVAAWWESLAFIDRVRAWWEELSQVYPEDFCFVRKMKALKDKLRIWNRDNFGVVGLQLKEKKSRLAKLEDLADNRTLQAHELEEFVALTAAVREKDRRVELFWQQKCRTRWIKGGDRNSGFFHRLVLYDRAGRLLSEVEVDGHVIQDPAAMKQAAKEHFARFFRRGDWLRPRVNGLQFKTLLPSDAQDLEVYASDVEIWEVVRGCDGSKTPGPDGFSIHFVQKAWSVLGREFCIIIRKFMASHQMPKRSNSSFMTLIPKREDAKRFSDFRPISLVSCYYKIISKLLANRLSKIIHKVISEEQHGFLSGKQTLDCVMVANETVHHLRHSNQEGLLLKLDFEKAYDSVDWVYLDDVLRLMGFGNR